MVKHGFRRGLWKGVLAGAVLCLAGCAAVTPNMQLPRTDFDVPLDPETRVNAWPAYVGDDKTGYILWPLIKIAEGEKRFLPFYSYDHGIHDSLFLLTIAPKYHLSELFPIWFQRDKWWLLFPLAYHAKDSKEAAFGMPVIPLLFRYAYSLEEDPEKRDWSWRVLTGGRFREWSVARTREGSYLFPLWWHGSVMRGGKEDENVWWSAMHFSMKLRTWHHWGVGPLGLPIVHGISRTRGDEDDYTYQAIYPLWMRLWYPHTEAYAWGTPLFGASRDPEAEEGWWYVLTCGSAWDTWQERAWVLPFLYHRKTTDGTERYWWTPVADYERTPKEREVGIGPLAIPLLYRHTTYYPTFDEKGEQESTSGYDFSFLCNLLGATHRKSPFFQKTRQSFAFLFHNERGALRYSSDDSSTTWHEVKTPLVDFEHNVRVWTPEDSGTTHHEEEHSFDLVKGLLWEWQRTLRDGALRSKGYSILWELLFDRHYYDAPERVASMEKLEKNTVTFNSEFNFLLWSFSTTTTHYAGYDAEASAILRKEREISYGLYGLLYDFEYEKQTEQQAASPLVPHQAEQTAGGTPVTTAYINDRRVLLGILYRGVQEENGSSFKRSLGGALFNKTYDAEKETRLFSLLGYLYRRESTPKLVRHSFFPGIQKTSNVNDEGWSFSIFHKVFRIERTSEGDLKWWLFGL